MDPLARRAAASSSCYEKCHFAAFDCHLIKYSIYLAMAQWRRQSSAAGMIAAVVLVVLMVGGGGGVGGVSAIGSGVGRYVV